MDIQVYTQTITRTQVVQAIMKIRHEWEDAAGGDSLVEVNVSVGYLLADVAAALGLTGNELKLALGDIAVELAEVLSQ